MGNYHVPASPPSGGSSLDQLASVQGSRPGGKPAPVHIPRTAIVAPVKLGPGELMRRGLLTAVGAAPILVIVLVLSFWVCERMVGSQAQAAAEEMQQQFNQHPIQPPNFNLRR